MPPQGESDVKASTHRVHRNREKKGRARFRGAMGFHKIQLIRDPHEISTYTVIIIYLAVSSTLAMPLIHKVHVQFKLTI